MTDDTRKRKLEAVRSSLVALLAIVEDTIADAETAVSDASDFLTAKQTLEIYGIGHDGLLNASEKGGLQLVRGARNKILVERAELERYLKTRTVKPRKAAPAADLDAWEAQAEKSLRSIGGRK
jgi:hypothetical protein